MGVTDSLKGKRLYLDACVFIYALEDIPDWRDSVLSVFQAIDRGDCEAKTSELTLALASAAVSRCDLFLTNDNRLKSSQIKILHLAELGSP